MKTQRIKVIIQVENKTRKKWVKEERVRKVMVICSLCSFVVSASLFFSVCVTFFLVLFSFSFVFWVFGSGFVKGFLWELFPGFWEGCFWVYCGFERLFLGLFLVGFWGLFLGLFFGFCGNFLSIFGRDLGKKMIKRKGNEFSKKSVAKFPILRHLPSRHDILLIVTPN